MEKRFLLIYGSQTGQGEAITEQIEEQAKSHGLLADRYCMSEMGKKFELDEVSCAVIVVSSTGEGEPPEKSAKLWKWLNSDLDKDHLQHLNYAFLGLGDSNYTSFGNFPKTMNKRLLELGAKPFYGYQLADDGVGLEIVVEPWIEGLWEPLKQELSKERTLPIKTKKVANHVEQNESAQIDSTKTADSTVEIKSSSKAESSSQTAQKEDEGQPKLTLPILSAAYLNLTVDAQAELPNQSESSNYLGMASPIFKVPIKAAKRLTSGNNVKLTLQLTLDIKETGLIFEPGDAFGISPENSKREVDELLSRLGVADTADTPVRIEVLSGTKKKNATVPVHIPPVTTLRQLFTNCLEIRARIKKLFLRVLAEYASDPKEKTELLKLCSREGDAEYLEKILLPWVTLLDLLNAYPSCKPPLERLLEHIPRMQFRNYSVASSRLVSQDHIDFIFNVVEIPALNGRIPHREGICTGWLSGLFKLGDGQGGNGDDGIESLMTQLTISKQPIIPIHKRSNSNFRLPEDPGAPLILIGPGVGIAPFIGFLQERSAIKEPKKDCWLFYGCRHETGDYLFRSELEGFQKCGALSRLFVCFSRDPPASEKSPRYVQDNIRLNAREFVGFLCDAGAHLYVCGDAKNMAKDVQAAILDVLQEIKGMTKQEADDYVLNLQKEKRYLQDVWT